MKHNKRKFIEKKMRLKDDHTWTAPKGYKIMVIDRGAVSFNFPASWHIAKFEPLELNDAKPPNDNARISVSFWKFPPGIDWTGLPLIPLLTQAIEGTELEILERGEIVKSDRKDLELIWTERRFMDPVEHREAYSRIAFARGWDVQALITMDFWADEREKHKPIWNEVMRSLQLGRVIQDPTKGVTLH